MAEHEPSVGQSDDWHTPPEFFEALRLPFDLDPCAPVSREFYWVPAARAYTKEDDGMAQPWEGSVFVNMPFGGRFGHVPWLRRFLDHGNGIAVVRAYTSSSWWHEEMPRAELIVFPKGKTKFIRGAPMWSADGKTLHPAGTRGNSPGHGVALIGMGAKNCEALKRSGLGMCWPIQPETVSGSLSSSIKKENGE